MLVDIWIGEKSEGLDLLQIANETSLHRQRCADRYSKLSREDMMCLLGDATDQLYPVYMQGTSGSFFHLGDDRNLSGLGNYKRTKHYEKNSMHFELSA